LCGARCFHDLLCDRRPSHIAANSIGDAGCIALSSSLVHLSHLEELHLSGKFVLWSGVLVAIDVFACDFLYVVCGGYGCEEEGTLLTFFANHVIVVCLLRCELRRHHEQHTAAREQAFFLVFLMRFDFHHHYHSKNMRFFGFVLVFDNLNDFFLFVFVFASLLSIV
jgi:hypothetical protein